MLASAAIRISTVHRRFPRWIVERRATGQLLGIVLLAIASFALSAFMLDRTWDARAWVRHTREVQLQIDRLVWDLLSLEHAMQAYNLGHDRQQLATFDAARFDIRDDVEKLAQLTQDNAHQRHLISDFDEVFTPYLDKLERLLSSREPAGADRDVAMAVSIDAGRLSRFIAQMRDHEDGLLKARAARAETMLVALLPVLSFSVALIAFLVIVAAQSINRSLRERDAALAAKTDELISKDMLMREVDHRARNSLGLVYNLMTFQQQRSGHTDATRSHLAEAANQVLVVARIHERLYKAGDSSTLAVGDYLRDLCDDVAAYALPGDARAAIRINAADAAIAAERLVWLGLIVVEFLTNAMKYAGPSVDSPVSIDVDLMQDDLTVSVADRGRGLPPDFDPQASKGLGMQVVCLLVKQLRGSLRIDRDWNGARFVITMPKAI